MSTFVLIIIYIVFIGLGLPDSLLGAAWPILHVDLGVLLTNAGLLSMIISGGTIISSLFSAKIINRFGTGKVTFVSVVMTAMALIGFSLLPSFLWLCIAAVPLGLGAGSVDSALNNFVALHYKAIHMSWLHCFWGVGATLGPVIMSFFISDNGGWRDGYLSIASLQFCIVLMLLISLPLWKKYEVKIKKQTIHTEKKKTLSNPLKIHGIKIVLVSFLFYGATEAATGLWGSSYLVNYKGVPADLAARWIALFYAGITLGRFLFGFATMKFKNHNLIRTGQIICIIGIVILILPLPTYFSMVGLCLIGLGCSPIFPCMLHETPDRFGESVSQSVMGLQMAFSYIGSTFIPPILGIIISETNIMIFPYFLLISIVTMLICSEKTNLYFTNILRR